jgi:hypothetical protein
VYTHTQDFVDVESEPDIDIVIKDAEGNTKWSISSPRESAPNPDQQPELFDAYFQKYSDIFQISSLSGKKAEYKIPLNLDTGTYTLSLTSPNYAKLQTQYEFRVSGAPYTFTDTNILFEE